MEEELQNCNPGSPVLADVIRQNITHQLDLNHKRTLFKESLLKISLDKDLQHLFEPANSFPPPLSERQTNTSQAFMQVSQQIKVVCQWLQDSQQFSGMAYLPFQSMARLVHVLHQKVEGTAIVITSYPHYWINKMEDLGRLAKLKWGILTASQQAEDKIRVLQLYELKKLKLLFITPSLFRCEEYHEFQCDVLVLGDLHLYHNHVSLIDRIIAKTNPNRVLAVHHTLMHQQYLPIIEKLRMPSISQPKSTNFNFLVLKTSKDEKFRTMMQFLAKSEHKRILILVNKRRQAYALNKKLIMESKTSINLYDYFTPNDMAVFRAEDVIERADNQKEEDKIFQLIKRINSSETTISKNTDFLRFCNFDIVIYYSFTDVTKFVQSCFTTKQKLLLFSEEDYYHERNIITSDFVTLEYLEKVVMRLVEKPIKKDENSRKRFYSDCIQDKILDCYTISKQFAEKDQQKVIRVNSFCRKHEISVKLLTKLLDSLQKNGVIGVNYRTIYEVEIDVESISRMKKQLPMIQEVRRKVNLLNVSTSLQKTIRSIQDQLIKEGIKFKITEEAIQIKILKNYEDIQWQILHKVVNGPVNTEAQTLDRSFTTFKECAYSSIELTRREKALQKKEVLLSFLKKENKEVSPSLMQSYHKSNLLTSEIEEWLRHSQEIAVTDHDLVLLLQGVQKGKLVQFKDDPIYGRYQHLRYQELMQVVTRIYTHKKVKLE